MWQLDIYGVVEGLVIFVVLDFWCLVVFASGMLQRDIFGDLVFAVVVLFFYGECHPLNAVAIIVKIPVGCLAKQPALAC